MQLFTNFIAKFQYWDNIIINNCSQMQIMFTGTCACCCFFSSPEPSGSQGELIVYPCSGVRCRRRRRCRRRPRRQQYLNIFSSETALPIKAKLYVEPPWEGGTKVYINGPGHMTKMAAMPIYGKNI